MLIQIIDYGVFPLFRTDANEDNKAAYLLKKINPGLCNDREKLASKIAEFDSEIDKLLQTKPKELEAAINITLQGRNAVAILLDVEAREVDCDFPIEAITLTAPAIPSDKFVGLICNSEGQIRAIKQILPQELQDETRFKILDSRDAVDAIISNNVAGLVNLDYHRNTYTTLDFAYSLRHDLKNRDGWNQERADNKILPPLFVTSIHQIYNGFGVALQMANGTYHSSEVVENKVNLPDYRSSLIARMKVSKYIPSVVIIDDNESCFSGMLYLLNIWPKIHLTIIHEFGDDIPKPRLADILLLDHDLGSKNYNGGDLLNYWYNNSPFKGTVISTTGGDTQPYGSYHFKRKAIMSIGDLAACHEFIALINQVLDTL